MHDYYSTVDLLIIYGKNEFTSLNYFKSVFLFSVLSSSRPNQTFYRCKNGEWAQGKIVFVEAHYTQFVIKTMQVSWFSENMSSLSMFMCSLSMSNVFYVHI